MHAFHEVLGLQKSYAKGSMCLHFFLGKQAMWSSYSQQGTESTKDDEPLAI